MNAFGICYGVACPITGETPGLPLTYGSPVVFPGLRQADLELERSEEQHYGDNVVQEYDNGVVGGGFTVSATGVTLEKESAIAGTVKSGSSPNKKYSITSKPSIPVGFGYIKNISINGVKKWVPFWIHKVFLGLNTIPGATRAGGITWTSPVYEGPLAGVIIDNTDTLHFVDELEECVTFAAAKAKIDAIAGVAGDPVATPTANPAAGSVAAETSLALSTATTGATIYYTTDGSTPTTGSMVYSTPLTIYGPITIKAIAIKDGMENSGVLSAAYTITE